MLWSAPSYPVSDSSGFLILRSPDSGGLRMPAWTAWRSLSLRHTGGRRPFGGIPCSRTTPLFLRLPARLEQVLLLPVRPLPFAHCRAALFRSFAGGMRNFISCLACLIRMLLFVPLHGRPVLTSGSFLRIILHAAFVRTFLPACIPLPPLCPLAARLWRRLLARRRAPLSLPLPLARARPRPRARPFRAALLPLVLSLSFPVCCGTAHFT